jgi:uncharacterized membrane protein
VIGLGRWRGLAALAALGVSFLVLVIFVFPAILHGRNALAVAVVGACLIMPTVLYLSHGFSVRTSTAVLGTLVSLGLIGVLGAVFAAASKLTGLDEETQNLLASLGSGSAIDPRGLLLAGFIIGALGVLHDVTVTQTSVVWELRRANSTLTAGRLFSSAMRIGRDHVSSAVSTLVLAYAGASLPLLLLFTVSGQGFGASLTQEQVATEVIRALVGSIGVVASVPITTGVAALVASREDPQPDDRLTIPLRQADHADAPNEPAVKLRLSSGCLLPDQSRQHQHSITGGPAQCPPTSSVVRPPSVSSCANRSDAAGANGDASGSPRSW